MITRDDISNLSDRELSYLYYCCDKEFDKNGYIYFDFDCIRNFKKQTIIDILYKYENTLQANEKEIPKSIITKLEDVD